MGLLIGNTSIKNGYKGGTGLKAVFVGSEKVRPTEITEVYTLSAIGTSSSSRAFIFKQNKSIKSITMEGNVVCHSGRGQIAYNCIVDNVGNFFASLYPGSSNVSYFGEFGFGRIDTTSTGTERQKIPTSYYPGSGQTKSYKFIFTRESLHIEVNGYSGTYNLTDTEKTTVKSLFDNPNIYVIQGTMGSSTSPACTVTVIYE